jgi:hypothetical protein
MFCKERSNTLVCPVDTVDRILSSSKTLKILFEEFEGFSLSCEVNSSEAVIMDKIKDKLLVALFQVNAILDGSNINLDEYLKAKKHENESLCLSLARDISNFKNFDFETNNALTTCSSTCSSKAKFGVTPNVKRNNGGESSGRFSTSKCVVLFDMTSEVLNENSTRSFEPKGIDSLLSTSTVDQQSDPKDSPVVITTPLRDARRAAKDTPFSPGVGNHALFPITLSPEEVKHNKLNRTESYERVLRSQQKIRHTNKKPTISDSDSISCGDQEEEEII